jgi:hypothetical protein
MTRKRMPLRRRGCRGLDDDGPARCSREARRLDAETPSHYSEALRLTFSEAVVC